MKQAGEGNKKKKGKERKEYNKQTVKRKERKT